MKSVKLNSTELQIENDQLKGIIFQTPGCVYWKDKKGVYLGCNRYFLEMIDLQSVDEVVGKTDRDFSWANQADMLIQHDKEVMRKGAKNFEETVTLANGDQLTYTVVKSPLYDKNKKVMGVIGSSLEITRLKKIQEELKIAKERAEFSDRAKSDFIANMSHDVKTPLSGIIGLSEVLIPQMIDPKSAEIVQMIHNGGQELLRFFENCLEVVKLESGNLSLVENDFSVQEVLEELKELFLPSIKNKGLELKIKIDKKMPQQVHGSYTGLYRIILNLLGNAIKFTETGIITINAKAAAKRTKDNKIPIIITLKDTGIGIPQNKLDTIFDRFTRVAPSYTGTYEGHGIGLYIVRKFVAGMGGTISVDSQLNHGSCFSIRIPFSEVKRKTKKASSRNKIVASTIIEKAIKSKNIKKSALVQAVSDADILLVEDNIMAQIIGRSLLERLGFRVDVANCGSQVLENFELNKYIFIFMDIGLPDMEGTAVARHIRKLEKGSRYHVPIVAFSAHATHSVKDKCLEAGMNDVLSKPLSEEKIIEILNKYLMATKKPQRKIKSPLSAIKITAKNSLPAVIDLQEGAKILGKNQAEAKAMLDVFVRTLPKDQATIAAAFSRKDWVELKDLVHRFYGGTFFCGVPALRQAAKHLDEALAGKHEKKIIQLYQQFVEALQEFIQAYQNF